MVDFLRQAQLHRHPQMFLLCKRLAVLYLAFGSELRASSPDLLQESGGQPKLPLILEVLVRNPDMILPYFWPLSPKDMDPTEGLE